MKASAYRPHICPSQSWHSSCKLISSSYKHPPASDTDFCRCLYCSVDRFYRSRNAGFCETLCKCSRKREKPLLMSDAWPLHWKQLSLSSEVFCGSLTRLIWARFLAGAMRSPAMRAIQVCGGRPCAMCHQTKVLVPLYASTAQRSRAPRAAVWAS